MDEIFTQLFDQVNQFEREWNPYLAKYIKMENILPEIYLNQLLQFNKTFFSDSTDVKIGLAKIIQDIIIGKQNESSLKIFHDKFEHVGDYRVTSLPFSRDIQLYIDHVRILGDLPNVTVLDKSEDFDEFLDKNHNEYIVVNSFDSKPIHKPENESEDDYFVFGGLLMEWPPIVNNVSYVAFNYEFYKRLPKHLVNKTDKRVISLMKNKQIIVYDLKQFHKNKDIIEQKVKEIENNIGKL